MTRRMPPPREPFQLESEIEDLRGELGRLVDEIDRRRREALDLRLQVRKHPVIASAGAIALAAAIGGTVAFLVWSRGRRRRPVERVRRARLALARLLDDPDRIAREPRIGEKMLAAAAAAGASMMAKRALARALGPMQATAASAHGMIRPDPATP